MSLTTLTAALNAYLANSLYDIHGSASECQSFMEAGRALMLLMPKQSKQGRMGSESTMNPELVAAALEKAEAWYAIHGSATSGGGAGQVRYMDFSDFRS